jgi:hypothetical protein
MHPSTRRRLLGCIAGAGAATLAGCQTDSSESARFTTVTTEGTALVVELDSSDGVDQLTVIDPDGGAFTTVEAAAGQTNYTIDIGTAYTPGEYELNIVSDGDATATTTIDLQPDVAITDLGVGENHPEKMPDSLDETLDVECFVEVENHGSGPTAIQRLAFNGDVPNPTGDSEDSGIYDADSGGGEAEKVIIDSNEQTTIFSSTLPFSFEGDGVDCESTPKSGEVIVRLAISNVSTVAASYKVRFSGADSYNGCTPQIVGRK